MKKSVNRPRFLNCPLIEIPKKQNCSLKDSSNGTDSIVDTPCILSSDQSYSMSISHPNKRQIGLSPISKIISSDLYYWQYWSGKFCRRGPRRSWKSLLKRGWSTGSTRRHCVLWRSCGACGAHVTARSRD